MKNKQRKLLKKIGRFLYQKCVEKQESSLVVVRGVVMRCTNEYVLTTAWKDFCIDQLVFFWVTFKGF